MFLFSVGMQAVVMYDIRVRFSVKSLQEDPPPNTV